MRWLAAALLLGCSGSKAPVPVAQQITPLEALAVAEDLDPNPNRLHVELVAARRDGAGTEFVYNGQSPGPLLRAQLGDELVVDLVNQLDMPTTVHWHGLEVPWEMDGVAWMGAPVMPGERKQYRFVLNQAGTFWYHPHFNTHHQVDGGLYGAIVVEDPADPPGDELTMIFDQAGETLDGHPAYGHGRHQPKWRINGAATPSTWTGNAGAVRGRIINASAHGYLALKWPSLRVIGTDQGIGARLETPADVVLAPGDRVEVEWLLGPEPIDIEALPYSLNGGRTVGEPQHLLTLAPEAVEPAPPARPWAFSGAAPSPDPGRIDAVYVFSGSDRTGEWYINGEQFPQVTIAEFQVGTDAYLEVRNLSPTEHPFHLHGLKFEVLSVNGVAPDLRQVEDTINLGVHEWVRLKVQVHTPGDWMLHCHILPHAEQGMMTVLRARP